MGEQNFWLIEIYSDETANISITSQEEVEALEDMGEIEEWMFEPVSEASEDEMIERAEEKGYDHDPW